MAVSTIVSVAFPFRRGPTGFPEPSIGARAVVDNVFSLLLMAEGELPMGEGIGTRIHGFVNETSGPLLGARVAQDVRSVIRTKEPRMVVLGVTTKEETSRDGTAVIASLEYEVAGVNGNLGIPVGEGGPVTT